MEIVIRDEQVVDVAKRAIHVFQDYKDSIVVKDDAIIVKNPEDVLKKLLTELARCEETVEVLENELLDCNDEDEYYILDDMDSDDS